MIGILHAKIKCNLCKIWINFNNPLLNETWGTNEGH